MSKSVSCLLAPIFLLLARGVLDHPTQGGNARAGAEQMGPEWRVLRSAFPVRLFSRPFPGSGVFFCAR